MKHNHDVLCFLQYVRVVLDPSLLEEVGGAAILANLESLDSKYTIEPQPVPSMVSWRRIDAGVNLGDDIQVQSQNNNTSVICIAYADCHLM